MIRILVVEDDPKLREGLRMRLSLEADMSVIDETDIANAPQAAASSQPDLILIDIGGPCCEGARAAAAARTLRRQSPHTPLVMVTLYSDVAQRRLAEELAPCRLLEKDSHCMVAVAREMAAAVR